MQHFLIAEFGCAASFWNFPTTIPFACQLLPRGSAFIPGNLAQRFIDEHDEVLIERIGGKQGRAKGDIRGIRFRVMKVNDQPLRLMVKGKIEKGRR